MKITHVAEIVNITNVAGILEAEICVAENMRAVLMYNPHRYFLVTEFNKTTHNIIWFSCNSKINLCIYYKAWFIRIVSFLKILNNGKHGFCNPNKSSSRHVYPKTVNLIFYE